jgi:small ligand-binding sensory domain FIST
MRFRLAHDTHPDWSVATEACLVQLGAQAGSREHVRGANLGFLYLTDALAPHAESILAMLKVRTGVPNWVGASGSAICATGTEYIDEPALAVMLGRFKPGSFNVFSGTQRPPAVGMRTDAGAEAAFTALVHADPGTPDLPELIHDMAGKVQSGFLFGGVASGRERVVQIADRVLSGGLSGVVFASDVPLVTRVTQGCHPLGQRAPHRVTRVQNNFLVELDERRAFDVLLEDAGLAPGQGEPMDAAHVKRVRGALQALGRRGLFVGLMPDDGAYRETATRDDYLVRQVVALDPSHGVVAVGAEPQVGDAVFFCTRDEAAARRDLVRICTQIRAQIEAEAEEAVAARTAAARTGGGEGPRGESTGTGAVRGAIYVSCVGRGAQLFGEVSEELRVIRECLGDVPLVGFYANGEIGGRNLYGFTGVLTVFR